ncbi:hypothetical protein KIW84_042944 [Lathyrus oleraceus]|uniref:3-hydroxyisobutyryl-CoA hydrolase n=1 Tax=Pisum sativum TaxID=3888 RepID=A0A9D5ANE2_PEA|nr:hypothetical protein KIW84_042944 [Pisum sativum]
MASRLRRLLRSWEDNPDFGFVMVKGSGRAFAAGGDIVVLYRLLKEGNMEACKEFFRIIYGFMYLLGISIPGTFRVATDKTVFATPEVLIGFHPDAATSLLPFTSTWPLRRVLGSDRGEAQRKQWGKLVTDDPSVIETTLEQYGGLAYPDNSNVLQRRIQKSRCSRRLYEGRVSQGLLTQTLVLFKFYLETRAGGVVADMMAANELNSHRFLQVRYFNHSILLLLHCGFETTVGGQWLSFRDYGKSSAEDYAKVASDKVSKLSLWNNFE